MSDPKRDAQDAIDSALAELRSHIAGAVRAEQLTDQLTGLGNDASLNGWIESQNESENEFWLAFIEVDKFKSVNDRFGYDAADGLLRRVAEQLRNAAHNFFGEPAMPFRAHGDEFFIGGSGDGEGVDAALVELASAVAAVKVKVPGKVGLMSCTVSTGWATSTDAANTAEGLGVRSLRGLLETTVAHAKRDRGCVLRYSSDLIELETREGRADCSRCGTRFTLHVLSTDVLTAELRCPNCGDPVTRPPSLFPPGVVTTG